MWGEVTFDFAESLLVESGEKEMETFVGQNGQSKQKARTVMVEDTEGVAVIITYFLKGKKQQ